VTVLSYKVRGIIGDSTSGLLVGTLNEAAAAASRLRREGATQIEVTDLADRPVDLSCLERIGTKPSSPYQARGESQGLLTR